MSKISEFVDYLNKAVGGAYVWGSQGHIIDFTTGHVTLDGKTVATSYVDWVKGRETSVTNANRALAYLADLKKKETKSVFCADCSGLGVYWLYNKKRYISADMSAASLFSACSVITRSQLKVGDFVFRHNGLRIHHIGYVVSVTGSKITVVEAMGRDSGIVSRDINASGASYWNRYGRFPELQESAVVVAPEAFFAKCGGSAVNIRSGRGTSYASYGKIALGTKMLALPDVDGWCEVAVYPEGRMVHGYMSEAYVKKET